MNIVEEEIAKYRNGKISRFEDIIVWKKARMVYGVLFEKFKKVYNESENISKMLVGLITITKKNYNL